MSNENKHPFKVGDKVRRWPSANNYIWEEHGHGTNAVYTVTGVTGKLGDHITLDGAPNSGRSDKGWHYENFELVERAEQPYVWISAAERLPAEGDFPILVRYLDGSLSVMHDTIPSYKLHWAPLQTPLMPKPTKVTVTIEVDVTDDRNQSALHGAWLTPMIQTLADAVNKELNGGS